MFSILNTLVELFIINILSTDLSHIQYFVIDFDIALGLF